MMDSSQSGWETDLEKYRKWESAGMQKARPAGELCWEEVVLCVFLGFPLHLAFYDKPKKRELDCPSYICPLHNPRGTSTWVTVTS